jgi:glutathione synthase/RimK-type ligase-like ATP-grasp enzyme
VIVHNPEDIERLLTEIKTETKVFKPIKGWGGSGILISDDDQEIIKHAQNKALYPAILQEFIDSSKGIHGVIDGLHDFRVIVVNGRIVMTSVRQPKEGSRLANVAQGGSLLEVPIEKLPDSAKEMVYKIDKKLAIYKNRIYSVDMVFSEGKKPYLVELNSWPGFNPTKNSIGAKRYIQSVADLLSNID